MDGGDVSEMNDGLESLSSPNTSSTPSSSPSAPSPSTPRDKSKNKPKTPTKPTTPQKAITVQLSSPQTTPSKPTPSPSHSRSSTSTTPKSIKVLKSSSTSSLAPFSPSSTPKPSVKSLEHKKPKQKLPEISLDPAIVRRQYLRISHSQLASIPSSASVDPRTLQSQSNYTMFVQSHPFDRELPVGYPNLKRNFHSQTPSSSLSFHFGEERSNEEKRNDSVMQIISNTPDFLKSAVNQLANSLLTSTNQSRSSEPLMSKEDCEFLQKTVNYYSEIPTSSNHRINEEEINDLKTLQLRGVDLSFLGFDSPSLPQKQPTTLPSSSDDLQHQLAENSDMLFALSQKQLQRTNPSLSVDEKQIFLKLTKSLGELTQHVMPDYLVHKNTVKSSRNDLAHRISASPAESVPNLISYSKIVPPLETSPTPQPSYTPRATSLTNLNISNTLLEKAQAAGLVPLSKPS